MSDTTRQEMREAFEAWAKDRDERHAGKIAANGLDYPLGRVLEEAWQAAWTASRQKALQEAEKIVDAELALWVAETGEAPVGLTSSNNVNISLKRSASNIRSLGGITSNEGDKERG